MTIPQAIQLIDQQVARGAAVTLKNDGLVIPETWTATLGPVWVGDTVAHPQCTAWSEDDAILGLGAFLARLVVR